MSVETRRVAIVGGGPKGMYCLERLAAYGARYSGTLAVDVYEPTGEPGAGAVYRSDQPTYLRLNFADRLIDAWPDDAARAAGNGRPRTGFAEWLERAGRGDDGGYAPRADVGGYMSECFEDVVAAAPSALRVHVRDCRVERIRREGGLWLLGSRAGDRAYDEVMLAVGHRSPAPGRARRATYPLDESLPVADFPPRAPVAVRGMALTFIDVALELTEGRGGYFAAADSDTGRLVYEPCGRQTGTITARSRSGRPMLVKPDPGSLTGGDLSSPPVQEGRRRVAGLPDEGFAESLAAVIAEVAGALLDANREEQDGPHLEATAVALRSILDPGADLGDPAERVRVSWEVATGLRAPDVWWALGEAWRGVYPALVGRGGHGGVPAAEWPAFAVLAREMERIAFGPPPINGAKLIALVDAGLVRLAGEPAPGARDIDAVSPAPGVGVGDGCGDLLDDLLAAGHVRPAPSRRGIEVGRDAGCVGANGEPTPGLAAVGRVTEDWVIGNDTLSRTLHSEPDRWAEAIVCR